ncbi:hypothetical protein MQK76_17905 [Vibrio cholerae]|nr:hypothetical protein [Vibrio paracholerae]MCU4218599.1 hypothetical protein [Vibrio cholerae]MCO7025298.1 hypothetical protein [Vibrio paracholerae]MCO7068672.1 hypothetical protein [Vibrio paracholerae]MCU4218679.1 hypothetical protein [Vibrio cholerae]
MKRQCVWHCKF